MTEQTSTSMPNEALATATAQIFVQDPETVATIRQSLASIGLASAQFVSGNIVTATEALTHNRSPRLLIVDISGLQDPIGHVSQLADACEPNTGVIVIGDRNDIALYRNLRQAGVVEYFFKPVVGDLVTRACDMVLKGEAEPAAARTGRLIFILGVRGGVGATTIAANTAWYLAESRPRLVMVVDLDLQAGDAALQFDVAPSHALREAFEQPERVDSLFIERAAIQVDHRLDLLASLEPLGDMVPIDETAVHALLEKLLARYRFVFVDLPAPLAMRMIQTLHMPSTCVLVSNGSLVSARDVARWREWIGPNTADRTTLHLLNQHGAPGCLPDAEFARAAGHAPDFVLPYERDIRTASTFGIKSTQLHATLKRNLAPLLRHLSGEQIEPPRSFLSRLFG